MGRELASDKSEFAEMEDVDYSDSELVSHVRDALKSVTLGDMGSYEQLRKVIHHNKCLAAEEVALLVTSLKALSGAVSYIDSAYHGTLLDSIFQMKLWDYGPDVMDAIVDLIISLAAASGKHIDSCLSMLVGNFVPPDSFVRLLKLPRGDERKGQVVDHIHTALQKITELVPVSPMKISDIIVKRMPPFFYKKALLVIYVENMLILESGSIGELIGNVMLKAVVDILVDFDVRIDLLPDDSSKGIFEMEVEDVENMHDDDLESDELHNIPSSLKKFRENTYAEILDSLLVLMFEHLKLCHDSGRLNKVFETLLGSFETTVLSAYKSKFSQFVMFYVCSLDPDSCGIRFAHILFNIFTDIREPPVKRMSAVAYLASYLSRAKFLPLPFVVEMLQRLVDWCLEYCENHDGDMKIEAHRVLYSGCQAMMYVLCFRMRSIIESPRLKLQLRRMHIDVILKQPLDPLKVCLPSIVEEFLRQAEAAGLFRLSNGGVFTDLLESELSRAFGGRELLDMFFPFDPCLLKELDRYIRPHYIFWSMVKPLYDNDDFEEIEANSEEEEDEDFIGRSTVVGDDSMAGSYEGQDLDEFECSMNKMSITPKNSFPHRFESERIGAMRMPSRIRPSTSPESL